MRIHLLSDLHLELQAWEPRVRDADVTILAGDIHKGDRVMAWARAHFSGPVLVVAGNHEFYGGHLEHTLTKMRAAACGRVRLLERDAVVIGGVRFLGTTAWTDYTATGNPALAQIDAMRVMTDFRRIRTAGLQGDYRRIVPRDLIVRNRASRLWLQGQLALPHAGPTVVITHHAPSVQCLLSHLPGMLYALPAPRDHLDAAYANRWEHLLGPAVALWVYGHTHAAFDQVIRGTRVVSNPRGYDEESTGFDAGKVIVLAGNASIASDA